MTNHQETNKVLIVTLGCRVNQADSETLAQNYLDEGCEIVRDGGQADICVINTCTVTAKADRQGRNAIRHLRKKYPKAKIIVTGCYANIAGDELKKMPEVDEISPILRARLAFRRDESRSLALSPSKGSRLRSNNKTRPQLKIQDGCDRFCAYCIVPYARGRSRSLPPDEIIKSVKYLQTAGYGEIVLTGIHLGGYGRDLSPETSLLELLKKFTRYEVRGAPARRRVSGGRCDFRVRLSSIDPDEWTPELIAFAASSKWICPHFHIPLQSGDDETLQEMGRRYTTAEYRKLVLDLKSKISNCAIGADVIVGFPGETDAHFERTAEFIEDLPIDYLHVFPYSRRAPTKAAAFKETVSMSEKQKRAKHLTAISEKKREAFYKSFIGKKLEVVIERGRDRENGLLKGISENYIPILIEGGDDLMGRMQKVIVTEVRGRKSEVRGRRTDEINR